MQSFTKSTTDSTILNLGAYFYKIAEHSQDVFWIRSADAKTRLLYVSPAYEMVWGLSCESLYNDALSWLASVSTEDRQQVESLLEQIRNDPKEGQTYKIEYHIFCLNQEIKRIKEIHFPIFFDHQLIGFAGIAKDVTKEKVRIAELEQASRFFKYFSEKVHAVFWARDDSCNKQLYLSPGYEKVWERSRDKLYANPNSWLDTLHPDDRGKVSNSVRLETLQTLGKDVQFEYRYRILTPKQEIRWIKDTSFPIQDEKNQFIGFAGIAEDITKEVLHEKKLRDAMERAEVANQAKSDFLAMISHELRTPLNAILGMAQILTMKKLSAEVQEYINIISNAGNSLLSLVSDILDFAKIEAGKLSFAEHSFDLVKLISQIVHSLQYQAKGKNIHLFFEETPDMLVTAAVIGDANRVRQVMVNLLSNAIKFTEKGFIKVAIQCIEQTSTQGKFEIIVEDTGIGMHADKLDSIFEKFSQIDSIYHRKHSGIGLGLAITKQLVEAMGGYIQVKSEYGVGSEFRFTLVLKLQPDKHKSLYEMDNLPSTSCFQFNMKVLVVEDNVVNQKIAKLMLEDFGCSVDIIDNGQAVMERVADLSHYDIIFMDVGLPDMSGFAIVSALRKIPYLKDMPIIAMTAHILERDRQQAFTAGMNQIMAKPITYYDVQMMLKAYYK